MWKELSLKNRIEMIALFLVALLAVASAIVSWWRANHITPISKTEYVKVPEIKEVVKIKKVEVPGPKVVETIEKKVIVEKLKLPDWVKDDIDQQVIATAEIPPYKGATDAVAILNTKTGKSDIIAKQRSLSFFDFVNEKEIGIRYGMNINQDGTKNQAAVYGKWDFVRVGNAYIGGYVEANTGSEAKAMVSVGYKF